MIEIHSHILPGLDDGALSTDEALEMARQAVSQGITHIIATPHHGDGAYETPRSVVVEATWRLNEICKQHEVPVTICEGQEIRVHAELIDEYEQNQLVTLAGSRYLLLELPPNHIPSYLGILIYELIIQGLVPVIAHPERNKEISTTPAKLGSFIEQGALCQLTSQSLTGAFGRKVQKLAFQLCKSRMIHFVSSDAHDCKVRPFALQEAYRTVCRVLGEEDVRRYQENGLRLLRNEEIGYEEPVMRTRRKLFW
ncbi:tyrosine-protein phosphatase [Paenibacillus sp. OV219]|uniref:tyrosine-protein phosphatase n=1 Tax=Paenibacillus sp. OV219 TaxID=1884377 RepID=UPI0008B8F5DD|nr:CpsB/CapC family capsule biosynthesis tyrosine phosphatase [Paenibacillus sp. OV219]SEO63799.1 protein-tyrosine phosphatase [Paenibacillus sp. OV219]